MPQAILTGGHDFQSCRKASIFDWASAPAVLGSDFFSKLSSSAAQKIRPLGGNRLTTAAANHDGRARIKRCRKQS